MGADVKYGNMDIAIEAAETATALWVETTAEEMHSTMVDVAPFGDGELQRGLDVRRDGRFARTLISEAAHTPEVITGTGERGAGGPEFEGRRASGDLIRPRRSSVLVFDVGGDTVFTPYTRGMEPQNFPERTLDIERPRIEGYGADACRQTRARYG